MITEIITYNDIVKEDEKGNIIKLKKKDYKVKLTINTENIVYISETFNPVIPRIYKNRCVINVSGIGNIIAKMKYEEAKKLMNKPILNNIEGYGRKCK